LLSFGARHFKASAVILSEDFMILRLTTLHENARSALDCGSEAAALNPKQKGGS
jgi:hypothetical protein